MEKNAYYINLKTWITLINNSNYPKLYHLIQQHNLNQILINIKQVHQNAETNELESLANKIEKFYIELKQLMDKENIEFYNNQTSVIRNITTAIIKRIQKGKLLIVSPAEMYNMIYFFCQHLAILLKCDSALININLIQIKHQLH